MASVPSVPVRIVSLGKIEPLTWQKVLRRLLLLQLVLDDVVAGGIHDGLVVHEEDRVLNLVVHSEEVVRRN